MASADEMRYADGGCQTAAACAKREAVRLQPAELFAARVAPPEVTNRLRVSDNLTAHHDAAMRTLIAARAWLTVFRFPSYAPELNPVEGVWAYPLKRGLDNLAARAGTNSTAMRCSKT